MLESTVEAALHREVRRAGGTTIKLLPNIAGVPDRLVVLGGQLYLVEMKTEGGRVDPLQKAWHAKMARYGVQVHVLWTTLQVKDWVAEHSSAT